MRSLNFKVAGVTYENRQEIIAKLQGTEPVVIKPEPENPYDKNAIAVVVGFEGEVYHIGYVPKELAAELAPLLEEEDLIGKIWNITGGFVKWDGTEATRGVVVIVDVPDPADMSAGWED